MKGSTVPAVQCSVLVICLLMLSGCEALQPTAQASQSVTKTDRGVVVCERESARSRCRRASEAQYQVLLRNLNQTTMGSRVTR
jgi:hypothetical protein